MPPRSDSIQKSPERLIGVVTILLIPAVLVNPKLLVIETSGKSIAKRLCNWYNVLSMKIAVIGKGGREQALVETLAASPCKPQMFTYPGSDAIKQTATPIPAGSFDELISWLVDNQIDLCVAGDRKSVV